MAKSMLQKLEEDFNRSIEGKIGGHAIGFYSENDRLIEPSYEFTYHDPHENIDNPPNTVTINGGFSIYPTPKKSDAIKGIGYKERKGTYTLKSQNGSFFWWNYNIGYRI